ncbi:MAG TPA: hypothetical protein ENJ00_07870, partial [Phycisphaerales bacterium]|nr:hypothetical protein [Phycisphaerales bacterium]
MNSPPPMDDLERALERLSESPNEPTQLWRRALDVARAEERDSLVHPKSHRDGDRSGRRLLIGLNAIGVAAMLALASGVWWMAMHPERARTTGRGSGIDTFSMTPNQQATTTPEPMELALADEQAEPDLVRNVPPTEFRAGSGFEIDEAAPADVDSSDTAMPKELETTARSRRSESQRSDRIAVLEMENTTG